MITNKGLSSSFGFKSLLSITTGGKVVLLQKKAFLFLLLAFTLIGLTFAPVAVYAIANSYIFIKKWGSYGEGEGRFNIPGDVAASGSYVYVTDANNKLIQKFNTNGVFIREWTAGPGGALYIDVAGGYVYVTRGSNEVLKFTTDGTLVKKWGQLCIMADGYGCTDPDGSGPLQKGDGQFADARGIAVSSGYVYVADLSNHRIQKFTADGTFVKKWGSKCDMETGSGCVDPDRLGPLQKGDGQFAYPSGIDVRSSDVYVSDFNSRVQKFNTDGKFITKWGQLCNVVSDYGCTDPDGSGPLQKGDGQFHAPTDLTVSSEPSIFVADLWNSRVQKFNTDGKFITKWGTRCVMSTGSGCVDPDGSGPLQRGDSQFFKLEGVAVSGGADFHVVYVADSYNHRIQVFKPFAPATTTASPSSGENGMNVS